MSAEHYGTGPVPPGVSAPAPGRAAPIRPEDLASYARRATAAIVDGVIVLGLSVAILALVGLGFFADGDVGVGDVIVGLVLLAVLFAALSLLYAPIVMASTNGATLGKLIAGCRVARADGLPMTFGFAVLREVLVKGLLGGLAGSATGGVSTLADYLWPLVDGQKRALHDMIVDTRVLNDSRRA